MHFYAKTDAYMRIFGISACGATPQAFFVEKNRMKDHPRPQNGRKAEGGGKNGGKRRGEKTPKGLQFSLKSAIMIN